MNFNRWVACGAFALASIGVLSASAFEAESLLQSGPMIGHASMAEVLIWVQTTESAEVRVRYWEQGQPDISWLTDPIVTEKHTAYVAKCLADRVRAGMRYDYEVLINGTPVHPQYREGYKLEGAIPTRFHTPANWRFREAGHEIFDFSVGFGSCAYINEPEGGYDRLNSRAYGGDYQIFESIYEVRPDVFIWLGDNVYLREPDWTSRTGFIHRWTHDRSTPHLRAFLANVPQYATWDDHDYGPNDAGREFWNKELATEIFTLFHGNPTAGVPGIPGIFTFFNWGDVNFYIMDNRTYRTVPVVDPAPFGQEPVLLGREQVDWLVEMLKFNQGQSRMGRNPSYLANFNVIAIGNQVISPVSRDGYPSYPDELQYLLDRIVHEGIDGVVFISGDVHFGEVSKLEYIGGGQPGVPGKAGVDGHVYTFYDVTSSPLTAGSWAGSTLQQNPFRYDIFPGERDRVGQRNFATLSFEGPLNDRVMIVRYYDSEGNLLNQEPNAAAGVTTPRSVFRANELRAPQQQ